jgi:hypothetical protein
VWAVEFALVHFPQTVFQVFNDAYHVFSLSSEIKIGSSFFNFFLCFHSTNIYSVSTDVLLWMFFDVYRAKEILTILMVSQQDGTRVKLPSPLV